MKEKIKRVFGWIWNSILLLGAIGSSIAGIKLGWDIMKEGVVKMTSNILQGIGALAFFILSIILFILWIKQRCGILKSKYDKLVKLTKLPKTFDRAITVEKSSNSAIITNHNGKFPHLRFDMCVINRTYHFYKAEEAKAKCYCGSEEVLDKEGTWDSDTKKSETFELVTDLPVWGQGDGVIRFHVPIKELYDDMTTWRLRGKVKYKSKEPLLTDDDTQYANPKIDIDVEYVLSEKQISKLKKEVEKALGDDI